MSKFESTICPNGHVNHLWKASITATRLQRAQRWGINKENAHARGVHATWGSRFSQTVKSPFVGIDGEMWMVSVPAWICSPLNCRMITHRKLAVVLDYAYSQLGSSSEPTYTHALVHIPPEKRGRFCFSSATAKILIGEFENLKWFRSPWMENVMYCAGCIMSHLSPVSKQQKSDRINTNVSEDGFNSFPFPSGTDWRRRRER